MKVVLINAILTVCLAMCFSSCSGTANSANGPHDESGEANTENANPKTTYPPLAEKIAQAELSHLDGSTSKIAERKGRVVLLNLWATWCGPCLSEMPTLVRLQEELGTENLEVIGLNVDSESVDLINPFKDKHHLNYTLGWPLDATLSELMRISKAQVIPQSFIVDREGKLRGVFVGANPREVRKMDALVRQIAAE